MRAFPAVIVFPRRACVLLKAQPRWMTVFMLLAMFQVTAQWMQSEAVTQEVLRHLPPSVTAPDRARATDILRADLPLRLLMEPIRLGVSWTAFAGLLWLMSRWVGVGVPVRWSQIWALEVHAETIPTLCAMISAVLTVATGTFRPDALSARVSLAAIPGITVSPPVLLLLSSVNLCTLWFVGVLGTGLAVLSESSRRSGMLAAGLSWGISAVGTPLLLHFLQTTLHLVV